MTTILATALTMLAGAAALTSPATASADDVCAPRVVQSETTFPISSQLRHQTGTVYIDVVIDEAGRAQIATVRESSGYRRLDRAARNSVVNNWVFDVSGCERKDLPANHLVAVDYRNNSY